MHSTLARLAPGPQRCPWPHVLELGIDTYETAGVPYVGSSGRTVSRITDALSSLLCCGSLAQMSGEFQSLLSALLELAGNHGCSRQPKCAAHKTHHTRGVRVVFARCLRSPGRAFAPPVSGDSLRWTQHAKTTKSRMFLNIASAHLLSIRPSVAVTLTLIQHEIAHLEVSLIDGLFFNRKNTRCTFA